MQVHVYAGWELDYSWVATREGLFLRTHKEYWNLAWLLYPQLDHLAGVKHQPGMTLDMVKPIINNMDANTFAALQMAPSSFMAYWDKVDDGTMALTDEAPHDYTYVMKVRAAQAEDRIYPALAHNIVRVDFKARRRLG